MKKIIDNMKKILLLGVVASCALLANAWGQKGHDTTAYIAEQHLTPATKHAVDSILGGQSLVYWANWLDNASHTPEYAYSKTWHYKNIDAGEAYEDAHHHPDGDIVRALEEQMLALMSDTLTQEQSALAIKMIAHLMGDLHQPLHMGHLSDLGGNTVKVKFFNKDTNLHSVWDTDLVESGHKWSYTEWQQQLDRLTPEEEDVIVAGSFDAWGKETFGLADLVYAATPEGTKISYDYIADWTPLIEQQFLKGGLRLASVLKFIFDQDVRVQDMINLAPQFESIDLNH